MLDRNHCAPTLSTALLGLLLTACGGGDDGADPQAALSECPASYSVTLLPLPSLSSSSSATGLNNLSQAVGEIGGDAALWAGGSFSAVPNTFGGFNSTALGINDSGQIVGAAETLTPNVYHAFRFRSGTTPEDLGTLGGSSSFAAGINNAGLIVGSSQLTPGSTTTHAFLYNGGMTDLGSLGGSASNAAGINTSGQIVGSSQVAGNTASHAFLYENGSMTDLGTLGGVESAARAINDAGQIAGSSQPTGSTDYHAFLYTAGTMTDISPAVSATASGINSRGHVVGRLAAAGSPNGWHAFRYCGGALSDLNQLLSGGAGTELLEATAINDLGEIVGVASSSTSSFPRAYLLRPL